MHSWGWQRDVQNWRPHRLLSSKYIHNRRRLKSPHDTLTMSLATPPVTAGKAASQRSLLHQECFWRTSAKWLPFEQMCSTFMGRPCEKMFSSPVRWFGPTIISVPSEFLFVFYSCWSPSLYRKSHAASGSVINGWQPEGLQKERKSTLKSSATAHSWRFFILHPAHHSTQPQWWRTCGLMTLLTNWLIIYG